MKKQYKILLDERTIRLLKSKAESVGFSNKGWLRQYLEYLAPKDIAFLDENFKKIAKSFVIK